MKGYDHKKLEKKWQGIWKRTKLYRTPDTSSKPKCYTLDMFPYPSGEGLHVGHPKGYIATDVYGRMKRMQGWSVLHPMGWDAFGLPAENFAIANKVHPEAAVKKNVARFKAQLEKLGFTFDWSREVHTTDPKYYRWTQWIFLQLYKKGLAYESFEPINWCPKDKTGLANEDVEDGKCERCGTKVEKKPMRQWVLAITRYADRMLKGLEGLPWPRSIIESQRNWIGRSEGGEITFRLFGVPGQEDGKHSVKVFTTRPDTLFGATFLAISPELAQSWINVGWQAPKNVRTFVSKELKLRTQNGHGKETEKRGIETGFSAENPARKDRIPVWVVNYVLGDVGTGAIMAVPAHDARDHEFAKKYGLPIRTVIEPVLTQTTGSAAFRQQEPMQDSKGIIALVKHWSEEKYMGLFWPAAQWGTLVTGGIDDGFTPEETALKEIREETGYVNAVIVEKLGVIHSKYYHAPKKLNRFGHAPTFFIQLQNGDRKEVSSEENAKHELRWLTKGELKGFLTATSHQHALLLLEGRKAYEGTGILTNSGKFDGMDSEEAKWAILEAVGGDEAITYKLKDWVFSRQRYWGEPIPMVHDKDGKPYPVDESDLPVLLPKVKSYEPTGTGESPLAGIPKWVNVRGYITKEGMFKLGKKAPKGLQLGDFRRETNTMPQWAGSSWYYLRYIDPKNAKALVDKNKEKYWSPVDLYVGGAEHATRHLIYARFWHKFLFDIGAVFSEEPFARLEHVGLINGPDGRKMSKRYGNVVNPDDVVATYGADTLRLYEMFMGPFDQAIAWSTESMIGSRRFLERVWRLSERVKRSGEMTKDGERVLHESIKKVGEDIEAFRFNTGISQLMILLNHLEKEVVLPRSAWKTVLLLIAPFAPFITEELWKATGEKGSIHSASWPAYDQQKLVKEEVSIGVQVAGKVRGTITVPMEASENDVLKLALENTEIAKWLNGKPPQRIIYVKGRILNLIPGG